MTDVEIEKLADALMRRLEPIIVNLEVQPTIAEYDLDSLARKVAMLMRRSDAKTS